MQRSTTVRIKKSKDRRLRQGDVIRDVEYLEHADIHKGKIELSKILFPYTIVLTQDCDLVQDYKFRWSRSSKKNQDKYLFSILVAPLYNYDHVRTGEHLEELELAMLEFPKSSNLIQKIKNNEIPRYHYLEFPSSIQIVPSIIDFKHYFSVPVSYLKEHKKDHFICQITSLNKEDIQHRFSSFLSRIALPE